VIFCDLFAAGAYGSWKTGHKYTWSAKGTRLSDENHERLKAQLTKARSDYKIERHKAQLLVAQSSQEKWFGASPAKAENPYLVTKGVEAHELRQIKNHLLVPLMDFHGKIWNLQTIYANGDKRFESGGRVSGMFCPIGAKPMGESSKLIICEGWATGASLHEILGELVLCAMNAGNLMKVAQGAREHFPDIEIVIAADNDRHTPGNPGLTKALEAAWLIQASVMSPQFPEGVTGTDFNDAARLGWRGE
jgi:putative DNA primase/helicase